ncbi:MAG: nicotinamide mononucleotide transporter [Bacteroidales bacterium]|nr:nicotinamide mononucleotide transporter [Bacteroidales bacterium]
MFTIGGNTVGYVEFFAVLSGLLCVFLAGRNSKYNFYVGYVYTILLCVMFAQKHLYSSMLLQPISLAINIIGHYRWTHPRKGEESAADNKALKVSRMTWKSVAASIVAVLGLGFVWGWILSGLGDNWFPGVAPARIPYLDACVTMLILLAQYLSAQKRWECWIAWLIVNCVNIVLYIKAGLVFMPIVSALYLINGIISMFSWNKLYKNNE